MSENKNTGAKKKGKVRTYIKGYKTEITVAHAFGYALGWEYAFNIPNRFMSKTAAAHGFKKGIRDNYRNAKYHETYKKQIRKDY